MRLDSGRKGDALVWALETLSDGTVVSGDSYGRVQVSTLIKPLHLVVRTVQGVILAFYCCGCWHEKRAFLTGSFNIAPESHNYEQPNVEDNHERTTIPLRVRLDGVSCICVLLSPLTMLAVQNVCLGRCNFLAT